MEHQVVTQRGNTLELKFVITNKTLWDNNTSPKFVISGNVVFHTRVVTSCQPSVFTGQRKQYIDLVFLSFHKVRPVETVDYNVMFTCKEFAIKDKCFATDDGTWRLIHQNKRQEDTYTFAIFMVIDVEPHAISLAPLHADEEMTDFELRCEDGAIRVHRAVLAAASPVLKSMFCGSCRETMEGYVNVSGTSKATLQHLKNYIYLSTLPEVGLEQLLVLAKCYMMSDLEQKCVVKLLRNLTAQYAYYLLEFSVKNNMTRLSLAVLESIQNREVEVEDIRKLLNLTNNCVVPVASTANVKVKSQSQ